MLVSMEGKKHYSVIFLKRFQWEQNSMLFSRFLINRSSFITKCTVLGLTGLTAESGLICSV